MVIGTSAIIDTEIDGAVGMNSGIFNNPFIIWGRYKKKWFRYYLPLSFQFRSEEHTSELQSRFDLVCRLLLEKKKTPLQKTTVATKSRDLFKPMTTYEHKK